LMGDIPVNASSRLDLSSLSAIEKI